MNVQLTNYKIVTLLLGIAMKLMLVILSFAVIGITTAMHMVDIKRDAPLKDPEMKRKIEDLIAVSITNKDKSD